MSWTDAVCATGSHFWRASFMSPIFLWFDESFGCCRSKCRKRIHKKKSQESSGKPSLQSTLRGSINRIPNKWRPWLSQKELSPIIDGFVTDLCSFWHQWTCFFYRSEDFFRLDSTVGGFITIRNKNWMFEFLIKMVKKISKHY